METSLLMGFLVHELRKERERNRELESQCDDLYDRLRNEGLHREMHGIIDPCSCGGPVQCAKCGKRLT